MSPAIPASMESPYDWAAVRGVMLGPNEWPEFLAWAEAQGWRVFLGEWGQAQGIPMYSAHSVETWNEDYCHCGEPVTYGFDGDPTHHRGMCRDCDAARCDAYPGECGR